MIKIYILFCALALTGCSAAIQPTLDFGPEPMTDGGRTDAGADPDLGPELDAGLEPDTAVPPDAGGDPDLGPDPDPDLGPDPDPDLGPDLGPVPCHLAVETVLCGDGRCCNEPCMGVLCAFGHAVSGNFCTCENTTCDGPETSCVFGALECLCL